MKFDGETMSSGRGRRDLLSTVGAALATGLAGCSGALERDGNGNENGNENENGNDGDSDSEPDGESTDPTELRETLAAADPYRMHQYGPAHVGSAAGGGPTADVDAVWSFREGTDDTYYEIGTPAIVDGTVYVAEGHSVGDDDAETVVYALDGATGEIEWEQSYRGTNVFGGTAVADGAVVQGISGSVVALEADSGTERWQVERDFADEVTVADGTVYAINTTYDSPGIVVAIDLETGDERWSVDLGSSFGFRPTPPAVADGTVYGGGTELVALSTTDGERQWSRDLEGTISGSPTVVDDACYVPVDDGTVAAFDRDGTPRWTQSVESGGWGSGGDPVTSPAVADGSVYVTNTWQLTALDADTGAQRWTTQTDGDHPPVVADGVVYLSGLNTMEAYAGADGDLLWRYGTDASSGSGAKVAPVVGGTVFLPSAGLHALRGTDGS